MNTEAFYKEKIKEITEYLELKVPEKRRVHTYGVRDTAIYLANKYGADPMKAEVCALFHDMFKKISVNQNNNYVKLLGLDDKYLDNLNLAHSKIASAVMKRDYDILDEDMLNAVSYHTTGRPNMSKLEKVIFLADAIEPNRDYPLVAKLREEADRDLDSACLMSMEGTIKLLTEQGKDIDRDTIDARDFLKKEIEHDK